MMSCKGCGSTQSYVEVHSPMWKYTVLVSYQCIFPKPRKPISETWSPEFEAGVL